MKLEYTYIQRTGSDQFQVVLKSVIPIHLPGETSIPSIRERILEGTFPTEEEATASATRLGDHRLVVSPDRTLLVTLLRKKYSSVASPSTKTVVQGMTTLPTFVSTETLNLEQENRYQYVGFAISPQNQIESVSEITGNSWEEAWRKTKNYALSHGFTPIIVSKILPDR